MSDHTSEAGGSARRSGSARSGSHRARVGRIGEDLAADIVVGMGWTVLQRNWRCRYGELDLIAVDGTTLVVVEVKTRTGDLYRDPTESVTPTKLSRMRRLTGIWLGGQDRRFAQIRFDVIAIKLDDLDPADTSRAGVRHHVGVFV